MRRRRRGIRPQWFPSLGTQIQQGDEYSSFEAYRDFSLFPVTGPPNVDDVKTLDLTFDQGAEVDLTQGTLPTMADWQDGAWRCRRVVGKLFVWQEPLTDNEASPADVPDVLVGAGLIVLRVKEDDGTPLAGAAQYNPLKAENIRDPWMWRRTWMLSCGGILLLTADAQNATIMNGNPFPSSNSYYGSVADGPHVDCKTNRVIGPEERLFLVVAAHAREGTFSAAAIISGLFDFRLLGSTMKATNRRNASR